MSTGASRCWQARTHRGSSGVYVGADAPCPNWAQRSETHYILKYNTTLLSYPEVINTASGDARLRFLHVPRRSVDLEHDNNERNVHVLFSPSSAASPAASYTYRSTQDLIIGKYVIALPWSGRRLKDMCFEYLFCLSAWRGYLLRMHYLCVGCFITS